MSEERLCICGADAAALTDEAHAIGCPDRPSMRVPLSNEPRKPLAPTMTEAELLAFVDEQGLDLLVHSPRSRLVIEWSVCAYDYDEPRLAGFGTGRSFVASLFAALRAFELCVTTTQKADAERDSTRPPPMSIAYMQGNSL